MTTTSFSENLRLVLKMLSMSGAQLASEMEIDKSVVSRWLKGSVLPSAHNLSRLSALIATQVEGFCSLDWEREPESLAEMFGADLEVIPTFRPSRPSPGLPLPIWDLMVTTTALRGEAYEGFFLCTRAAPLQPGRFSHMYSMIRRDEVGLLRIATGTAGTVVDGWLIPLHDKLYVIAVDVTSGALGFGVFNGTGAARVDVFDGLTLVTDFDPGRTPIAKAMLCERIGELSGDREADDRRFAELAARPPLAPEGAVPKHVQDHLVRNFGPDQLAVGGDLFLNMALARSMTRGPFGPTATPAA